MIGTKNKRKRMKINWAEIIIVGLIIITLGFGIGCVIGNVETADYIVETNAFFAPFEFYSGQTIKGVDIDIISKVADKMGKKISVKDVEFDVIIDNVEAGKIADAGAAGLTITEARKEKVDFTVPYYTSIQYVIYRRDTFEYDPEYLKWSELAGKKIGSQMGGTGYLFAQDEMEKGELIESSTELKGFESHQLAADAILSGMLDFAIADELMAKCIVEKNDALVAVPLYHTGKDGAPDSPTQESYAIAVNKNHPELLEAFNSVLGEMLEKGEDGKNEIERLVLNYTGILNERFLR